MQPKNVDAATRVTCTCGVLAVVWSNLPKVTGKRFALFCQMCLVVGASCTRMRFFSQQSCLCFERFRSWAQRSRYGGRICSSFLQLSVFAIPQTLCNVTCPPTVSLQQVDTTSLMALSSGECASHLSLHRGVHSWKHGTSLFRIFYDGINGASSKRWFQRSCKDVGEHIFQYICKMAVTHDSKRCRYSFKCGVVFFWWGRERIPPTQRSERYCFCVA